LKLHLLYFFKFHRFYPKVVVIAHL
jgi:hypothetical protein